MSDRRIASEHITLRAPNEILRRVDAIARRTGATRSRVIVDALWAHLDARKPRDDSTAA